MVKSPHNFSPISRLDTLAFASARPGFPSKSVSDIEVHSWIQFMNSHHIEHVLSLLGDDETEKYYRNIDLDTVMRTAFGPDRYTRISIVNPNASSIICGAFDAARESGKRFVIHCSGGEGRVSIAMACWLVHCHGIEPHTAIEEIERHVDLCPGVVRRPDVAKVMHLITHGTMTGFSK